VLIEVCKSIMTAFQADGNCVAKLTNGLWYTQAPIETVPPYGVFYWVSMVQDEYMNDADDNIRNITIQFSLFTEADDGGKEIGEMMEAVKATFDWATLTVDDYTMVKMQPVLVGPVEFIDETWQVNLDYELGIIKT